MAHDTDQLIGFRFELDGDEVGTAETDPISDDGSPANDPDDRYWKIGIRTNRFKDNFPLEIHEINPRYVAGQRNPSNIEVIKSYVMEAISYYPVNLIPYYMLLGGEGNGHSESGGEHTITNINTGNQDTFTTRWEQTGGSATKYKSAVGCKAHTLSGLLERRPGYGALSHVLGYDAIKVMTATLNAPHSGTKFPTSNATMAGTEQKLKYDDSTIDFRWDSGGDNIDYSTELLALNFLLINTHALEFVENQTELEYIDEGNFTFTFNFSVIRGADISLYDDFMTGTLYDWYLSLGDTTGTHWIKHAFTDAKINLKGPYAFGKDDKLWFVSGMSKGITITGEDGLHGSAAQTEFYHEATP